MLENILSKRDIVAGGLKKELNPARDIILEHHEAKPKDIVQQILQLMNYPTMHLKKQKMLQRRRWHQFLRTTIKNMHLKQLRSLKFRNLGQLRVQEVVTELPSRAQVGAVHMHLRLNTELQMQLAILAIMIGRALVYKLLSGTCVPPMQG